MGNILGYAIITTISFCAGAIYGASLTLRMSTQEFAAHKENIRRRSGEQI